MTQEEAIQLQAIRAAQVKAASAGFTQSLINNGADEQMAKAAAAYYAGPGGTLEKRAANIARCRQMVLAAVQNLHQR